MFWKSNSSLISQYISHLRVDSFHILKTGQLQVIGRPLITLMIPSKDLSSNRQETARVAEKNRREEARVAEELPV